MIHCYIFDIDGTLSDPGHRLHHVTNGRKEWKEFFGKLHLDPLCGPVADLLTDLHARGQKILIVTGRPEEYRKATEEWLINNWIFFDKLYMRKKGDYRPDAIVKKEILDQILSEGFEPIMVFDDRQSVVDMWRENGLVCAQVAPNVRPDPINLVKDKELLFMMVGPSGAGKSTIAQKTFAAREIISSDEIRADLTGNFMDQTQNDKVFKILHYLVKARLECGLRTCVDATNLRRRDRLAILALVPTGVGVVYCVVNRPMALKVKDGGWRNDVPGLLEKHEQRFQSQLKDIMSGDGMGVRVEDMRT